MSERGELKIYSYARPHCQRFSEEEFATVGQFQQAVEEWFGIPTEEQKFVKDGRLVEEKWKAVSFHQLKITTSSHLVVLSKTSKTFQKKAQSKIAKPKIDQSVNRSRRERRDQHREDIKSTKILSFLKASTLNTLITNFIRVLRIPKAELLLLDESKLQFILKKIAAGIPPLKEMLLSNLDAVKLALLDESKMHPSKYSVETAPAEAVNYLISLSYQRGRAVRALEICRNDLYGALNLLSGSNQTQLITVSFEVKRQSSISEFISISQWLGKPANKPLLFLLKHKPEELAIFMNFWKHVCLELFEAMARWQAYLPNLLAYHQARL